MTKNISCIIKLQIPAGKANPSPPIGPALGQRGLNIMDFCKLFNSRTSKMEVGIPVSVLVKVFKDKTFDFIVKSPPTTLLIKKFAKIKAGSSNPNIKKVGKLNSNQIEEIFEIKKNDLTSYSKKSGIKTIIGSAKSIGVDVE